MLIPCIIIVRRKRCNPWPSSLEAWARNFERICQKSQNKKIYETYYSNNHGLSDMIKFVLFFLEARKEFMTISRWFFGGIEANKNCN